MSTQNCTHPIQASWEKLLKVPTIATWGGPRIADAGFFFMAVPMLWEVLPN